MVIRISELKLRVGHSQEELESAICHILRLPHAASSAMPPYEIMRRSVDARKKTDLFYVYTIDVRLPHPQSAVKKLKNRHVTAVEPVTYKFPEPLPTAKRSQMGRGDLPPSEGEGAIPLPLPTAKRFQMGEDASNRPIIVGSGPAGLFCALMLARAGLCPIVLERGEDVDKRTGSVRHFWETGELNPSSNVQFGEGGAGTFSDGKLNTLIKDPDGKIRFVLHEFVKAGADPSILWSHKPHIGTDVLTHVVKQIRKEIIRLGGEVRFETCVTDIQLQDGSAGNIPNCGKSTDAFGLNKLPLNGGYLLELNHGETILPCKWVVLAIGHSARDTFHMLKKTGFALEAKAFAVGLRAEHSQEMINRAMYGSGKIAALGAAPYKLTHKCANGRGVYTFCMCPGGYVVNASSEPGMTAVNGMSYHDRSGENANSAIVVTVTPEDYRQYCEGQFHDSLCPPRSGSELAEASCRRADARGQSHDSLCPPRSGSEWADLNEDPLSGIYFQQMLERAAFQSGNGRIPVQRFEDFCQMSAARAADPYRLPGEDRGAISELLSSSSREFANVLMPQNKGQWCMADVRSILPEELNISIIEGMHAFGNKIPGFDAPEVLLSGVESRTSSPVRILRGSDCQSVSHPGIFPCGEGAGYAGGITSAAVDGIRVAEAICKIVSDC